MDTESIHEVIEKVCAYEPCRRSFRAERGDPRLPSFCTMGHWLEARRRQPDTRRAR